ncbi:glycosyltransferase 87 family protein [Allokutzneria sp. A3M-2-11 16]|uniref:glycosyltransferase 87 family protein n=1 Tax=Allokutzneria sp. A3M-2-11 16 TaxID=2962043 RepID=UPI0020B733F8|nr:glycosyltransferase 87 family protein [Allokutzneria sp. A3M-2-11 16]MCP3804830.1 glycosyltransferase 87 family protein [Allokutzneria sp. A3M-2-11 16]
MPDTSGRIAHRAALLAFVACTALAGWLAFTVTERAPFFDLEIYRAGGDAWLRGLRLYETGFPYLPTGMHLPFTYPPFAAILFSPLALVPLPTAAVATSVLTVAALIATCALTARHHGLRVPSALAVGAGAAAIMVLSEPMVITLILGQVNAVLMLLVVADCLLPRTPWPRGLLIGIAAAIKLTPAAFLLYFLVARQWRPMRTAALTFLAATLTALVLAPQDSLRYWFGTLLHTDRIGTPHFYTNQSLRALLGRLGLPDTVLFPLWITCAAATAAVAYVAARRLRARGHDLAALLVVAIAGLLCSPVSWSNHWVWVAPALVGGALAARRPGNRCMAALAGTAVLVLFLGPHQYVPGGADRELR